MIVKLTWFFLMNFHLWGNLSCLRKTIIHKWHLPKIQNFLPLSSRPVLTHLGTKTHPPGISLIQTILEQTQPAWDVLEMSQSDLNWERNLKDLSETSLKRRLFFETSLRRLKHISKKMSLLRRLFCDVFKASQIISKKMFFRWRRRL